MTPSGPLAGPRGAKGLLRSARPLDGRTPPPYSAVVARQLHTGYDLGAPPVLLGRAYAALARGELNAAVGAVQGAVATKPGREQNDASKQDSVPMAVGDAFEGC
jgi:hypothetical protein